MNKKNLIIISIVLLISAVSIALVILKTKAALPIRIGQNSALSVLLAQLKESEEKKDYLSVKDTYQKLINEFPEQDAVMSWQKKIEDINMRLLFSPSLTPRTALYEIRPGDSLAKIANEFKTTTDLIMKSNNLSDTKILPGKKIKVWIAPFNILVDKSQNVLTLKSGEEIIKTYVVSTGKDNSTPVGNFKIINKLMNPTWFKAGAAVPADSPENILGTRWLGFNLAGYGIHGTTEPESLGSQVTQGCVRMANHEVEELYTIVPVGTEVTIAD